MKSKILKIKTSKGEKLVGDGQPVFIVAEISGNHSQSLDRAYKLIDAAAGAGVDAIKLQTYTADTITLDSSKPWFKIEHGEWAGTTLYELYKKAFTPWEWQPKLKEYAEKRGLICFSTPFDETAVNFLEKIEMPAYKIASLEIVDIPLIKKVGNTRKPVIISRGIASVREIKAAVKTLEQSGCSEIAVLHCVSAYPAKDDQMNLSVIPDISKRFGVVSGLSDHTLGDLAAVAAVALGAKIIEKHFILKRKDGGPDAAFSSEPEEMKLLVNNVRLVEKFLGSSDYKAGTEEVKNRIFRPSLFVVKDIKKGEKFTFENVKSIRPGFGLEPRFFEKILGKRAKNDIERGTPLDKRLIK